MLNVSTFESNLQTSRLGRHLRHFDIVSSTNDLARDWCERGAPDGAVVFAEEQTAGRGRMDRKWFSEREKNLTLSVVIRNRFPAELLNLAVVGTAVAVSSAITDLYSVETSIKWPNDVLIEGKKCCGILFETDSSNAESLNIIAGIGVNVNQLQFDANYMTPPTSIASELGHAISREMLLCDILAYIENELAILSSEASGVHLRYQQHLSGIGEVVTFQKHQGAETVTGIAAGIDRDGALQIMTPSGLRRFVAGEITSHV